MLGRVISKRFLYALTKDAGMAEPMLFLVLLVVVFFFFSMMYTRWFLPVLFGLAVVYIYVVDYMAIGIRKMLKALFRNYILPLFKRV